MHESQLTTPCCGKPMVPIEGHNAGRPCVMLNPDNEVVQCHRCGEIWFPAAGVVEAREGEFYWTVADNLRGVLGHMADEDADPAELETLLAATKVLMRRAAERGYTEK